MKTITELQATADALWKAQQVVKKAEAKLRPLKGIAEQLEEELMQAMLEAKLESVATKDATMSLKRSQFVECFDYPALWKWAKKNDASDVFSKRPSITALRLRWEDKITVPGCRPGERTDLSVTARK